MAPDAAVRHSASARKRRALSPGLIRKRGECRGDKWGARYLRTQLADEQGLPDGSVQFLNACRHVVGVVVDLDPVTLVQVVKQDHIAVGIDDDRAGNFDLDGLFTTHGVLDTDLLVLLVLVDDLAGDVPPAAIGSLRPNSLLA